MTSKFISLAPRNIAAADATAVSTYNKTAPAKYRLHTELGPYAFEGDPERARVALLLSNPGYGPDSPPDAHTFRREGWPLSGHHPDAPAGTYRWHRKLLGRLIEAVGAERVAKCVLKLELTPWASEAIDTNLALPSRALIHAAATELANRGVVLVVLRSEREWLKVPAVLASPKRHRVNNWRCAALSPGNLTPEGWSAVLSAVRS